MKPRICLLLALIVLALLSVSCGKEPVATAHTGETLPPVTTLAPASESATVPAELGTLQVEKFYEMDSSAFSQILRTELDSDGEQIAIYGTGVLHDVTVEWGTMNPEGTAFVPDHEIYSAREMQPDTVIVICAYLADVVPNIRIVYTGQEGTQTRYVFQSGKDGSLLLIE